MNKDNTFAEKIHSLRTNRGLSQKELCRLAAVNDSAIKDIESGKTRNPRWDTLSKIANVFGVSVAYLAGQGEASTNITPFPAPAPAVDEELLAGAIEVVEDWLTSNRRTLDPTGKAKCVSLAYKVLAKSQAEDEDMNKAKDNVVLFLEHFVS